MKKIGSIIVMLLFAFSMLPLTLAENNETGQNEPMAVTAAPLMDAGESLVEDIEDVDECIEKMKKDYPRMDKRRIEDVCKTLIKAKENAKKREEARTEIKERIENGEGEQVREEIKERIRIRNEELRERIEIKMKSRLSESQEYKIQKFLEEHPELEDKINNLSDEEIAKIALFDREKIRELAKEKNLTDKLKEYQVKKVKIENLYQKREIAKEKYEQARERYEKAKERYENSKEKFLEARERFEKAVKTGNETQAIEEAKEYLGNGIEMIISSLEKVKENANSNDDLTEEEVEDIVSNADAKIAEMTELQEQLEAVETKEEIKEIAQKVNQEWARIKLHVSYGAAKAFDSKVGEILSRSDQLQEKLERTLLRLEEKGYDITDLDEKVEEFNAKITSAEEHYDAGKEILAEIKDLRVEENLSKEEFDNMMDEAKENIKQAHEELKEAQILIKEIVKEAKDLDENVSFEDEDEEYEVIVEVEEETEEEDEEEIETEEENETESEDETENDETESEEENEIESEDEEEVESEEEIETNETEEQDLDETIVPETENNETEDLNNTSAEEE